MNFVGIDLAWSYKNETGICVVDQDKHVVYLDAKNYKDEEIVSLVKNYSDVIISIDSPLVVKNETGGRAVDSMLMKQVIQGRYLKLYATSRSYMLKTFGQIRGEHIYKLLVNECNVELGKDIVETFPTGVFLSLFPEIFDRRYKISSKNSLEDLIENAKLLLMKIEELGFKGVSMDLEAITTKKAYKTYEDKIDGLLCSINSYYFYHGQSSIYKCDDNGVTALPNHELI